jgi:serine/threonine kinase PknH
MGPMGQPPKRNWAPIIIAAVVAFVLVLGGVIVAVVLMNRNENKGNNVASSTTTASSSTTTTSSKTRTSTTRSSTAPATTSGTSAASQRLMGLLPSGYGAGVCKAIDPVTDALATVDCEKNTEPGGPDVARYSLFPDQATLDKHFQSAIKEDDEMLVCPGADSQSPISWHYTSTPDKVEGQVACGTYKGGPDVIWTRNADLMLADGEGPDMGPLHQWWLKYG